MRSPTPVPGCHKYQIFMCMNVVHNYPKAGICLCSLIKTWSSNMKAGEYTGRNLISNHSKCVLVLQILVICVGLEKTLVQNKAAKRSHGFPYHPKTASNSSFGDLLPQVLDYYVKR